MREVALESLADAEEARVAAESTYGVLVASHQRSLWEFQHALTEFQLIEERNVDCMQR